jgi:hypothetical protein
MMVRNPQEAGWFFLLSAVILLFFIQIGWRKYQTAKQARKQNQHDAFEAQKVNRLNEMKTQL